MNKPGAGRPSKTYGSRELRSRTVVEAEVADLGRADDPEQQPGTVEYARAQKKLAGSVYVAVFLLL